MLLDLSAAFDTVDHHKLLEILHKEIGITGTPLKWFKSFLIGRCQRVKVGDKESFEVIIKFGVPQGSVLGPVLFNIYIRSLYATIRRMNFNVHGYADAHQGYKSFKCVDEYSVLAHEVPKCFNDISDWMNYHYLQLNPGKTEFIVFGTPAVLLALVLSSNYPQWSKILDLGLTTLLPSVISSTNLNLHVTAS